MPLHSALSRTEFVALMAMLTATVAFSIDAMLPALPQIAADLSADAPNRAQLVITSFVLGLGLGTFLVGPLSDRFGRKPVILVGAGVYIAAGGAAMFAPSLDILLAARILQGLGASAPRIVALAIVRDQASGREMARLLSFIMLVFSLVPAIAPTIGAGLLLIGPWQTIFAAFVVFSILTVGWFALRQPETLVTPRPLRVAPLWAALKQMLSMAVVRDAILVQTLCYAMLFAALSSTQYVFAQTFDQGAAFPLWFGLIAILAASASILNARIVVRLGMALLVRRMLSVQIGLSMLMIAVWLAVPTLAFPVYVIWTTSIFFMAGMTLGNLNAIGMEPLPHIAGFAASLMGGLATIGSVMIAAPIGLAFDGTPLPVAIGILLCAAAARVLSRRF
ncbi:multidrug effflux MFS transporter [Nereida sp. MMG025]|uniref:multidrug effflux MFS transporter n=1 Tax=Nereida sp. MMG025 TaxID=2909981 RepID=UPI001F33984B|nr:multidrug effflux MFS transporter [Nereida sp. MMG025]MCF6443284.1 multidrug effflux MFS transporter [Nereida sp. MMG025]